MLRSESIIMIREKVLEGKSAYAVSKELGFSKNTVKKYVDQKNTDKHGYPTRASKLDPYKNEINKLMSNGVFNCVVILEHIAKLGYDGKITILKDYVAPFRPPKNIPAVKRYETLPGKQAQMDWGICQYTDVKGNVRKVSAFTMVLERVFTRLMIHDTLIKKGAIDVFNRFNRRTMGNHKATVRWDENIQMEQKNTGQRRALYQSHGVSVEKFAQ